MHAHMLCIYLFIGAAYMRSIHSDKNYQKQTTAILPHKNLQPRHITSNAQSTEVFSSSSQVTKSSISDHRVSREPYIFTRKYVDDATTFADFNLYDIEDSLTMIKNQYFKDIDGSTDASYLEKTTALRDFSPSSSFNLESDGTQYTVGSDPYETFESTTTSDKFQTTELRDRDEFGITQISFKSSSFPKSEFHLNGEVEAPKHFDDMKMRDQNIHRNISDILNISTYLTKKRYKYPKKFKGLSNCMLCSKRRYGPRQTSPTTKSTLPQNFFVFAKYKKKKYGKKMFVKQNRYRNSTTSTTTESSLMKLIQAHEDTVRKMWPNQFNYNRKRSLLKTTVDDPIHLSNVAKEPKETVIHKRSVNRRCKTVAQNNRFGKSFNFHHKSNPQERLQRLVKFNNMWRKCWQINARVDNSVQQTSSDPNTESEYYDPLHPRIDDLLAQIPTITDENSSLNVLSTIKKQESELSTSTISLGIPETNTSSFYTVQETSNLTTRKGILNKSYTNQSNKILNNPESGDVSKKVQALREMVIEKVHEVLRTANYPDASKTTGMTKATSKPPTIQETSTLATTTKLFHNENNRFTMAMYPKPSSRKTSDSEYNQSDNISPLKDIVIQKVYEALRTASDKLEAVDNSTETFKNCDYFNNSTLTLTEKGNLHYKKSDNKPHATLRKNTTIEIEKERGRTRIPWSFSKSSTKAAPTSLFESEQPVGPKCTEYPSVSIAPSSLRGEFINAASTKNSTDRSSSTPILPAPMSITKQKPFIVPSAHRASSHSAGTSTSGSTPSTPSISLLAINKTIGSMLTNNIKKQVALLSEATTKKYRVRNRVYKFDIYYAVHQCKDNKTHSLLDAFPNASNNSNTIVINSEFHVQNPNKG